MPGIESMLRTANRIVPGQTTITYRVGNAGAGTSVAGARKRPVTIDQQAVAAAMNLGSVDAVWVLPSMSLGATVPALEDTVDDGTDRWFVRHVESGLNGAEFKCLCLRGK